MIKLIFTDPLEGLDLPERTELGPFDSIRYEFGSFFHRDERIAQAFKETINDMMNCPGGHPAAGYVFTPRTFNDSEQEDPEFPGKGYGKMEIVSA